MLWTGKKEITPGPKTIKLYPTYGTRQIDFDIIDLINEYRNNNKLTKIIFNQELSNAAYSHCLYMSVKEKPSHDYATERQEHFAPQLVGEIVAYNYQNAASTVSAWIYSKEHCKILLKTNYLFIGVATAYDKENRPYVTALLMN